MSLFRSPYSEGLLNKARRKVKFWICAPYYYVGYEAWLCNLSKRYFKKDINILKTLGHRNPFIASYGQNVFANKVGPVLKKIIDDAPSFKDRFKSGQSIPLKSKF